jgi:4-carboxymuconolactone decarboxylase
MITTGLKEYFTVLRLRAISLIDSSMNSFSQNQLHSEQGIPEFLLRGNRFKPLSWENMSPEQRDMTRAVLGGKRGDMQGPYNVLLHSPEVGQLAQQFGAHTRFNSSLPLALNELAILLVARDWTAQFVWWAHRRIAEEAGLSIELIESIASQRSPPNNLGDEVEATYHFCKELIQNRTVSDDRFEKVRVLFAERGVVDLMATMSYYTLVCMSLNVDGYPLPDGVSPELTPKK